MKSKQKGKQFIEAKLYHAQTTIIAEIKNEQSQQKYNYRYQSYHTWTIQVEYYCNTDKKKKNYRDNRNTTVENTQNK